MSYAKPQMRKMKCKTTLNKKVEYMIRANVLKAAFIWSEAPKSDTFWHSQWVGLQKGKELSDEARSLIRKMFD